MNARKPVPGSLVATVGEALAIAFYQLHPEDRRALAVEMMATSAHHTDGTYCCSGFLHSAGCVLIAYGEGLAPRYLGTYAASAVLDGQVEDLLADLPTAPPWDVVRAGFAALHRAGPDAVRAALVDVEDPREPILADDSCEVVGYT